MLGILLRACLFQRACPSIIAGWPCGLSFWPPRAASNNILPSWESLAPLWPWFILFLSLSFSSRILDQQCLWSLGSPGQQFNLSGSILPGGRRVCLENLSDDCWGQCHYSACQSRNRWKLRLLNTTPFIPDAPIWIKYLLGFNHSFFSLSTL